MLTEVQAAQIDGACKVLRAVARRADIHSISLSVDVGGNVLVTCRDDAWIVVAETRAVSTNDDRDDHPHTPPSEAVQAIALRAQ